MMMAAGRLDKRVLDERRSNPELVILRSALVLGSNWDDATRNIKP
jgi:hypothetical protein